ncbi:MAG: PrgI family protein [Patescibacteria group bacterium]|nr:PrgI family protein [Patescibacteria group bacterium]
MEPHPVPQNITSFEFHLVGDMTLKQFGYLASGLGIAYLIFVLLFNTIPLLAITLIAISAGSGFAFAFLPLYDRPLSHWVSAYFRAIYSPTKRYWQNPLSPNSTVSADDPAFRNRLKDFLSTIVSAEPQAPTPTSAENLIIQNQPSPTPASPSTNKPVTLADQNSIPSNSQIEQPQPTSNSSQASSITAQNNQEPVVSFSPTNSTPNNPTAVNTSPSPQPITSPYFASTQPTQQTTFNQVTTTQQTIPMIGVTNPAPITPLPVVHPPAPPSSTPPSPQDMPRPEELTELVKLAQEARSVQSKVAETQRRINEIKASISTQGSQSADYTEQAQQMFSNLQNLIKETEDLSTKTSQIVKTSPKAKAPKVVVVQPTKRTPTQVLLTSTPNVINGIVTDPEGNYLDGVIAIIHNKDNLPVRALKTNKLGQFAGATPLPSGVYTLTLEKDNLEFDSIQITLNGEVLPPINISAKRGVTVLND